MTTAFDRLPQISPLCLEGNVAQNWKKWKRDFNDYLEATESDVKSDKVKLGLLRYLIGDEGKDIISTLEFTPATDAAVLTKVLEKLDNFFDQRKTTLYDRFRVYTMEPHEGEVIDHFLTRLKIAVEKGDFGDQKENILRDRIVFVQKDEGLKDRLFEKGDIPLTAALEMIRGHETKKMKDQLLGDTVTSISVHAMKRNTRTEKLDYITNCQKCGLNHEKRGCPAFGKTCNNCGKQNHFAIKCRSSDFKQTRSNRGGKYKGHKTESHNWNRKKNRNIHKLSDTSDSSDSDESVTIGHIKAIHANRSSSSWNEDVIICNTKVKCKLDTGAEAAVMPGKVYEQLNPRPELKPTETVLSVYGGTKLYPLGKIKVLCKVGNMSKRVKFVVVDKTNEPTLLGLKACDQFGLIKRTGFCIDKINKTNEFKTIIGGLNEHADVFNGIGCYQGEYHLKVDPNIKPVVHAPRKVALSLQEELRLELNEMVKNEIISHVDYPTEWVNSLVIVEKPNGKLRLCIDPRDLNKALKREHYQMPTPEEILTKFKGMKYFTVLDLKWGFWNIKLDNDSADLTTFNTPFGRYRFNRLPFGINVAPEIFQKSNDKRFGDLPGVGISMDDFLIGGSTQMEMDENLMKVLKRAKDVNAKFNVEKVQYCKEEVKYLGRIVTGSGTAIDPHKIRAIQELESPRDKHDLRRILGMVNYLMPYVPNLADLTAPLRMLNKVDVEWIWDENLEKAFKALKQEICNATALVHFDTNSPVVVQCDASKSGLGACLMQAGKPVMYTSRALTPTEQQYAQIEKELLSVVNACQKFHYYVYGRDVIIQTDHKPLVSIIKKPFDKITSRLQRFVLRLQRYRIELIYKPGKEMYIADTLSRNYLPYSDVKQENTLEVHQIGVRTVTGPWGDDIQRVMHQDEEATLLVQYVRSGWPERKNMVPESLRNLWQYRNKFSVRNGFLLFDDKLFIPFTLRPNILSLLHESHQGIEKTKSKARQSFYWPCMGLDIERMVNKCATCLKYRSAKPKEPLTPHPVPNYAWEKVGCDIFEYGNDTYLLIVDYYSKYPEVVRLKAKTASAVIKACKVVFARFGIPEVVMADNVPFNSFEFRSFAKKWSFNLDTSSPRYPRSNGLAERNVQTMKQLLRKAADSGNDPELALLEFRTTPIAGLQTSPAQLLMSRTLRTKLPTLVKRLAPKTGEMAQLLEARQDRQKFFHDRTARMSKEIKTGSTGRVWDGDQWKPCRILEKTEYPKSYNILTEEGRVLRRTKSHLCNTDEEFKAHETNPDEQIKQTPATVDGPRDSILAPRRSGRVTKGPKYLDDYVT